MRPRSPLHLVAVVGVLGAGGLGIACGGDDGASRRRSTRQPLFDSRHAPTVLVESREVSRPPERVPNRLVRGWTPWRRDDGYWLVPGPGARLQIVDLEARPRRLVLDGEALGDGEVGAEVTVDGRSRRVVLAARTTIELPATGEPGRRSIELQLERPGSYALRAATVEPAAAGGRVTCDGANCRQKGPSILEAVRRVAPGTRLSGLFLPPSRPGPEQRFELLARGAEGGEQVLFAWRAGDGGRRRDPLAFDVEIAPAGVADLAGPGVAWVRLGFRASGAGSPAAWRRLRLHRPVAGRRYEITPPPPPRLVIVYLMDAWRADHATHLGGEPGLTPTVDRLAAAGSTFTRFHAIAPNTLPAVKTLLTGRVFLTRGGRSLDPAGAPTLAERFAAAGYRTALFSGNGHVSRAQGTARGFEHVDESVVFGQPPPTGADPGYNDNAERVHRAALGWLDRLPPEAPAFLYLHTTHPHPPYDPPADLVERFAGAGDSAGSAIDGATETLLAIDRGRYRPSAADKRRLAALYAASVAYNDRELGRLLADLGERYEPGEVLLVLTSDHGEELFDHGGVLHGYTLYDELLHVPLVVHWPRLVPAGVVEAPSGTVELHDGLAALVDPAAAARSSGFWRHLFTSPAAGVGTEPEVQFAAASSVPGGIFSARTARWKLIWAPQTGPAWGMGSGPGRSHDGEYLFDLAAGDETVNLAGERHPEVDWLRSRLAAWVATGLAAEEVGIEPRLDAPARRRLRALGYVDE